MRAPRIVIVGGGIAGLAAAYQLTHPPREERGGRPEVVLIEAGNRLGGKIRTRREAGFVMEAGPDSFITRKPAALELVRSLGLESQVVRARRGLHVYVVRDGSLVPLPDGMSLMIPTELRPFLASPLLSVRGRLRAIAEPLVPRRRRGGEESIGSFTRRRYGSEALLRIAEPMMAGIHLGDPDRLTMDTFPHLLALEREHGSLTRAMRRRRRRASRDRSGGGIVFSSLASGMESLVEALAASLEGQVGIMLETQATGITGTPDGSLSIRFKRASGSDDAMEADAVIVATPAHVAAALLAQIDPDAAGTLGSFAAVSSATVNLGFTDGSFFAGLDGTGFVVPRIEGLALRGCTWSSIKLPGRCPDGGFLMRGFVGGPGAHATVSLPDAELARLVADELRGVMGAFGEPDVVRVHRYVEATPQYEVGHADRVGSLASLEERGVILAGSPYRGVGIPDCVADGTRAAALATERLG